MSYCPPFRAHSYTGPVATAKIPTVGCWRDGGGIAMGLTMRIAVGFAVEFAVRFAVGIAVLINLVFGF